MTSNEMNLQQYVDILRAHAKLVIRIFIVAVAIAGIITFFTPKMYMAYTSLNFEFKGENPFAEVRGAAAWTGDSYIATQLDVIRSTNVAQKVVDNLTQNERNYLITSLKDEDTIIDKLMGGISGFVGSVFSSDDNRVQKGDTGSKENASEKIKVQSPYNWLAQSIGRNLTVEPLYGSRIVNISYASTNPQVAALMANKYAEAYIIVNLEMIIDPAQKTKVWFDEQLKSLRKNLQDSQSRLTAFQQKEGIVATDERIDTESKRLQALSNQLVAAQQETREAVTQQLQLKEILDKGHSVMTYPKVFDNPVVRKIKSDIRTLEGKHVEISSRLGKNHPKNKQVRQELDAARDRLNTEVKVITDGIDNEVELSKERELDIAKAIEAQKQLVLDLKHEFDRIAVLAREVESEQLTYNSALKLLNETSMRSMVDQTNVSIMDPASVPGTHSSPQLMVNISLGGFIGLLLGIGVVMFMEVLTRKVHSKEDIIAEIGVPLLGQLKKA